MAGSRKSSRNRGARAAPPEARGPDALAARVAARLADIVRSGERLTAGLSGGVDSVVLLDCLARAARELKFRLSALHVNHQLRPRAARWQAFCRRWCRARGVPFSSVRVRVRRDGAGPEAAARVARYRALLGRDGDYVVLAHHRDDQVETFLLQLLRGAGVKGLAAMPLLRREHRVERGGEGSQGRSRHASRLAPRILRPLLDETRADILAYARARGLEWIEDDSNRDTRLRRNFLRRIVLPIVARHYPAYRETIARAAGHMAEAAALLEEVAEADAGRWVGEGTLAVAGLRRLSPVRARNLLRHFLAGHGVAPPPAARLGEAVRQILEARADAQVAVALPGGVLHRFAGRIHCVVGPASSRFRGRRWQGERRLALPELGGVLTMDRGAGRGVSLARLRGQTVTVRVRQGGERLQPDCGRPRRSLKNLLQEARVPPWQRERMPLIFCGEELVWAPGLGVDCRYRASRGAPSVSPDWTLKPAPGTQRFRRGGIRKS